MKHIVLCITRKPGMTPEAFRHHYETSHAPLAIKHMGHLMKGYKRFYPEYRTPTIEESSHGIDRSPPLYDAITTITLADQAAIDEFWRIAMSPGIAEQFAEDEAKHIDRDKLLIHVSDMEFTF